MKYRNSTRSWILAHVRSQECSAGLRIPPVQLPAVLVSANEKTAEWRFSLAETEGFEPSEPFTARLVSSEVLSTTQPRLLRFTTETGFVPPGTPSDEMTPRVIS